MESCLKIDKALFSKMLSHVADLMIEQRGYFDELDAKFGDGDHGVTVEKIAKTIQRQLEGWAGQSISDFLSDLGEKIMTIGGGASSVLWGAWIGGLSQPAVSQEALDAEVVKSMFISALKEISSTTMARVGDKTMMDALIPAVEAARSAPDEIAEILKSAASAAKQGAKDTQNFVCSYGRAKYYGEKTLGTPDAGALSASLFFEGLASTLAK